MKRSILIIVLLKIIADVLVAYMILFNLMMMVNAFYQQHLLKDEQVMIAMEIATNAMIVMNLKIIVVNSKNVKKGIPLFLIAEFAKLVIILNTQMEIVLNLVKEKLIQILILKEIKSNMICCFYCWCCFLKINNSIRLNNFNHIKNFVLKFK